MDNNNCNYRNYLLLHIFVIIVVIIIMIIKHVIIIVNFSLFNAGKIRYISPDYKIE